MSSRHWCSQGKFMSQCRHEKRNSKRPDSSRVQGLAEQRRAADTRRPREHERGSLCISSNSQRSPTISDIRRQQGSRIRDEIAMCSAHVPKRAGATREMVGQHVEGCQSTPNPREIPSSELWGDYHVGALRCNVGAPKNVAGGAPLIARRVADSVSGSSVECPSCRVSPVPGIAQGRLSL